MPHRRVPTELLSSIFVSNENKNKEATTLIWCDRNINAREDTIKTSKLLQQINDYVLIFSNLEKCVEYITQIKTEKVFLILSGQGANEICDQVHNLTQIDSIYIFCMKSSRYEHYLHDHEKYYKLVGIYTEYEPLLKSIQENIRYFNKQSEATSLFEQDERAMKNLNNESHEFDAFRAFKYVLLKTDFNREQAKREMLEICRNYYRGNFKEIANINEFEQTYESTKAIYWYTRQTFVYRLVNKALRTEDYEALLTLRFFMTDLCENLRIKYDELKQRQRQQGSSIVISYRGLKLSPSEIYYLKYNIGKCIATNGFLSTSRSKDVANAFAKKASKRTGVETVILEISIDVTKLNTVLADIAEYSDFPEEQEVLFDLGASFIIQSVIYNDDEKFWWIKLSSISEELSTNNIQMLIKNCTETDMSMLLGELLLKMGHLSKCRTYLENLLSSYGNIAKIESLMGWTYEDEKDYDQAIIHYTKAFDRYSSSHQWEDAARVACFIAACYYGKKDNKTARRYTENAYELSKNEAHLPHNHCQFGIIMNTFGALEAKNNQLAMNYYMKALNIYQNASKKCKCAHHDDRLAQTYENIGLRYRDDGNYTQAIAYFQKGEKLRSKYIILSRERKAYVQCLTVLCGFYVAIKDEMGMYTYHKKLTEFMDNTLIESVHGYSVDAQKFLLESKTKDNVSDSLLAHEFKVLKSLEKTQPFDYEKVIEQHLAIGEIYIKTKDYKWAREHYDKTYELCETKIVRKDKQAKRLFDIGHRLLVDDVDSALKFFNKALEIQLSIMKNDNVNIGFTYYHMALVYECKEMLDTVIEYFQKAISIFERNLNDKHNYQFNVKELFAKCYFNSAFIYRKKQEFHKAIEYWIKSVDIIEDFFYDITDNCCILAKCYRFIAMTYSQISNSDASITFYKKYLKTIEKHSPQVLHNHSNEIAEALFSLGTLYLDKNDCEQCNSYYEKFISVHPNNVSFSYSQIAMCYMNRKHYEKAIDNYKRAKFYITNNDDLDAQCLMYMGVCYAQLDKSQYDNAMDCTFKAIQFYKEDSIKNQSSLAACYLNHSNILLKKGQYNKSIEIANQSLLLQTENKLLRTLTYFVLGYCYYEKCEYQIAFNHIKSSLENHKKYSPKLNDEVSANIYGLLAKCLVQLDHLKQALSNALKSQKISNKLTSTLTLEKADNYALLALIYSKQHDYKKSSEYCEIAVNICKKLITNKGKIDDIGRTFESLGESYMNQNNVKQARKYSQKALKYYTQYLVDNHPKIGSLKSITDKLL